MPSRGVGFFLGGLLLTRPSASTAAVAGHGWRLAASPLLGNPGLAAREIRPAMKQKPGLLEPLLHERRHQRVVAWPVSFFGARTMVLVSWLRTLPVFLGTTLGWAFLEVAASWAFWVIGYGIVSGRRPNPATGLAAAARRALRRQFWSALLNRRSSP